MSRIAVCAVLLTLSSGCFSGYSDDVPPAGELRVRRAQFVDEVMLSGELEAARGESLNVPPLPSWQTSIKWIAEDGAAVGAGEKVVELDNTALTAELDGKRQTATQTRQELQQREAQWSADIEQKVLEVDKRKSELDKAKVNAAVPRDLLADRRFEEFQTALHRATTEYEKAVDTLAAARTGADAERRNLILRIEKAEREIARAESAIDALVLRAPRAGIVVIRDIPWEGRKLQAGDPVWVGFPLALLPELSSIRVKAKLADVDDGKVAIGMPAVVTLDGYPDTPFNGKVSAVSSIAQTSSRASLRRHFDVIVTLDRLDEQRMRPGLSARVVVRRDGGRTALLAPRAAIDFSAGTPRAVLANGSSREVRIGSCNALDCVVIEGLKEGERLAPVVEVKRG